MHLCIEYSQVQLAVYGVLLFVTATGHCVCVSFDNGCACRSIKI